MPTMTAELLRPADVVRAIGRGLQCHHVRRMARRGQIPTVAVGPKWRCVRREDVELVEKVAQARGYLTEL